MNWTNLWIKLFGTTKFMGLDMGFWVSIAVVIVVVILMNVIKDKIFPSNIRK